MLHAALKEFDYDVEAFDKLVSAKDLCYVTWLKISNDLRSFKETIKELQKELYELEKQ